MTTTTDRPLAWQAARAYLKSGLSVIPIRADGSKAPAVDEWTTYKNRLPTQEEVDRWFSSECGVAVIGGAVSGGLETLDFENEDTFREWLEIVHSQAEWLEKKFIVTVTPGKYLRDDGTRIPGRHVRYRVKEFKVPGNLKLAFDLHGGKKRCLIETRGEGGYALAPGSCPEAHEARLTYRNIEGHRVSDVVTISAIERGLLINAAKSLNRYVEPEADFAQKKVGEAAGDRPGDRFNAAADWSFLRDYGWRMVTQPAGGGRATWKRPGKPTPGVSATTGFCKAQDGTDRLYVFSSNAHPFEADRCYSPFSAYALLKFNGDFHAAAVALAEKYGDGPAGRVVVKALPAEGELAGEEDVDPKAAEFVVRDGEVVEEADPTPELPPFPDWIYPDPVRRFVREVSEAADVSLDYPGSILFAVASAAVGNFARVQVKPGHEESATIYLAIVGDPGEGKTPVMNYVARPFRDWSLHLHEKYVDDLARWEGEHAEWEARKKAKPDEAGKAPPKPPYPNTYSTDYTKEVLVEMLRDTPKGVTLYQDELTAIVTSMNQYRSGGKGSDRQFFLEMWANADIKNDRKAHGGKPIVVKSPFLTIYGGIQPQMLNALQDEMGREDGFVHRFLYVQTPATPMRPYNWSHVSDRSAAAWRDCFLRVAALMPTFDQVRNRVAPVVMPLTERAREVWREWDRCFVRRVNEEHPDFKPHMMKMRVYSFRLSLVLHMLRWGCGEIPDYHQVDEQSVLRGTALIDYLIPHTLKSYGQLRNRADDWKAEKLLEWMRKQGKREIFLSDIYKGGPRFARAASSELDKLLKFMADKRWGTLCESEETVRGKKRRWFELANGNDEESETRA